MEVSKSVKEKAKKIVTSMRLERITCQEFQERVAEMFRS